MIFSGKTTESHLFEFTDYVLQTSLRYLPYPNL